MNTKQRALVLDIVRSAHDHKTAEAIYYAAKERMPQIAMGTVYRNLGLLAADGEIRKLEVPDGPDRYDCALEPHEHLYCTGCGKIVDLFCEDLTPVFEKATGKKIVSYSLALRGLCEDCAKKQL